MTQTTAHPGYTHSLRIGHHANPDDVRRAVQNAGHPTRFTGHPATAIVASVNVKPPGATGHQLRQGGRVKGF